MALHNRKSCMPETTTTARDLSEPQICPHWADCAQNLLNIFAPRSVHVCQIWSRLVAVCWSYSQKVAFTDTHSHCCIDFFSSCMRVMNHNWSAKKQRLHLQSVAEISRDSVLSGERIRQCGTLSGSHHKDTDQCL